MEFKREDLSHLCSILKDVVAKTSQVPILMYIRFDLIGSRGFVSGFNGSVGAVVDFDTKGLQCLIPFSRFSKLITSLRDEVIDLEVKGTLLTVAYGNNTSSMQALPVAEFPDFSEIAEEAESEGWAPPDDLTEGLGLCAPFAAKRTTREEFLGVCIRDDVAQATDAQRIAVYRFDHDVIKGSIVIPSSVVTAAVRAGTIQNIYIDDDRVSFVTDKAVTFGNLIGTPFPDVSQYFPKVGKLFLLPNEELKAGLLRVGDFTGDVIEDCYCQVVFGDAIEVNYKGETAKITEFFDFGKQISKASFKVNPYHFSCMLDKCDGFSIMKTDKVSYLYGGSNDKKFRCVVSLGEAK